MGNESLLEGADAPRNVVGAVGELIKIAGDDPQARQAARNLGRTAVTVTEAINTALLPVAAINFAFEKARRYFAGDFQRDLLDRTKDIPIGEVCTPSNAVAGPALQGLAFTHEEPALREMYLRLLATAVDRRKTETAHPAFVEIIRQLAPSEAPKLTLLLRSVQSLPIVELASHHPQEEGWLPLLRHVMQCDNPATGEPEEDPYRAAMVDNWIRLGLAEVHYDRILSGPNMYSWVSTRPEYAAHYNAQARLGRQLVVTSGYIARTSFGLQFARATGLLDEVPPAPVAPGT